MRTFLIVIGFIIVSTLVYLGFYNAFYVPKFSAHQEGGETVVYKQVNVRYQLTDSVMKDVFNELYERNGIVITKGYGLFYFKPNNQSEKLVTRQAGCVVEDKDTSQLASISKEYLIEKLPEGEFIVTDFPLKGKMSIMFGMYRVYPKLNDYCEKNGYSTKEPIIEIYDRKAKKIHYRRKLMR